MKHDEHYYAGNLFQIIHEFFVCTKTIVVDTEWQGRSMHLFWLQIKVLKIFTEKLFYVMPLGTL